MSELRIAVVLCTYNGQAFLKDQLESLAKQTRLPDELLVRDDGSTDDTLEILRTFGSAAPFSVRILPTSERLGPEENFLSAAAQASADVICFCDQDDVWHEKKLAVIEEEFRSDPALMLLGHNAWIADRNLAPTGTLWAEESSRSYELGEYVVERDHFPGFATAFRAFLAQIPFRNRLNDFLWERKMSHDLWIEFLAGLFGRVRCLGTPLAFYRQHGGNASGGVQHSRENTEGARAPEGFGSTAYRKRAEFLRTWATQLKALARDTPEEYQRQLLRGAERLAQAVRWNEGRDRIYNRGNPVSRVVALIGLVRCGGYQKTARAFGRRALMKDCVMAFAPDLGKRLIFAAAARRARG